MNPYIYKVTDKVTGQFYIGSQCRGKVIGKNYFTSSKNKIFKNKFKSNPAQFEIKIIGTFTNPESCVLQENIFIKFYIKNPLCLNKNYVIGKEHQFCMSGSHHSEETKNKMSESKYGENNPFYGKHHTDKSKEKISDAQKGTHLTEDVKKKISESHIGIYHTDVSKNKMSIIKKGKIPTEETKRKISKAHIGKHHTDKSKKKISDARKGTHLTEDVKKKISNTLKGKPQYYRRRKIICVETQIIYDSAKEAAISVNASSGHITDCAKYKRKTTKGFHWEYAD